MVGLILCTFFVSGEFPFNFSNYYPTILSLTAGFVCCDVNRIKGTAVSVDYKQSVTVEILNFPCKILSISKGPGNVDV